MFHIEVGLDRDCYIKSESDDKCVDYQFGTKQELILTRNGKEAINLLLQALHLQPDEEVFITSTFGTKYVSKCVTCSVFNYCQPSKVITEKTKVIYIIHEFGVPHPETFNLIEFAKEKEIFVVEDCAHSSNSFFDQKNKIGGFADFSIYSLKKIFPMNTGGVLAVKNAKYKNKIEVLDNDPERNEIESKFDEFAPLNDLFSQKRKDNHARLERFVKAKCHFQSSKLISPYVFSIELIQAKKFCEKFNEHYGNMYECVTWFGLDVVSFPVHQLMNDKDIDDLARKINQILDKI